MLKVELSLDHVNLILRVLGERSYDVVAPIIETLRAQCAPQLEVQDKKPQEKS
jgi:hypothetical protein